MVVAEIEPALVGWLRDGTVPYDPALLADDRLEVRVADVADVIGEAEDEFDLVLLDVDNGPRYLVHEQNAALYRPDFLSTAVAVLRPGGALVVWSADEAPELEAALVEAAGNAEARPFDVRLQERDEQYWLYVARVPSAA